MVDTGGANVHRVRGMHGQGGHRNGRDWKDVEHGAKGQRSSDTGGGSRRWLRGFPWSASQVIGVANQFGVEPGVAPPQGDSRSAMMLFISAISRFWASMISSASSLARGSSMLARWLVRIAIEWCGIIASIQATSPIVS